MSDSTMLSTGIILLIVVTIAYGGTFLVRVSTGSVPTNDLQKSFFRAGHGHAGILVILGLVVRLLLAEPAVPAWSVALGDLVLIAAILMPAGFFLSVIGRDPDRPNRWRIMIYVGAASLTVGLVGSGLGLIAAAR
ncbi:MAG: hypothetical protein L0H41_16625 [Microlunatus sp.]|nr:hypothetical protein [Microlunatus sp.]MDN5804186.1 hypothetical protein [Microlunatus sp.]